MSDNVKLRHTWCGTWDECPGDPADDALVLCGVHEVAHRLSEQEAELERYREALNEIAAWRDGPAVNSSFDEPGSATIARVALRRVELGGPLTQDSPEEGREQ